MDKEYKVSSSPRFGVVGYGSWATALVKILLDNNNHVNWFVRNPTVLEHLKTNKTNPRYLSEVHFYTHSLDISADINEVVENSDVIILAVPSAFLKSHLADLKGSLGGKFIISAIKGIVPEEYVTIAEYMNQHYDISFDNIGIITGPCHAEEVALERLSYLTMVCKNEENARVLSEKFQTKYTKITTSTDIYGTEYAAVLKNIYAIAVGICHGLGYGDNFMAVIVSNSAMEMNRFLNETFPTDRDTNASAYLGDLLVTCNSQFSRNRSFGIMVGKGYSVKNAQIEMDMIAEGYYASACIDQINKRFGVKMPIAETVHQILYGGKSPARQINILLDKLK